MINLCYENVKDAYRAYKKPSLSTADHNVVHLVPVYCTKLQREKQVQLGGSVVLESFWGCFECTLWDALTEGKSLEKGTDVVSSYITFCTEMLVPTKIIKSISKQQTMDNQISQNNFEC